MRYRWSNRSPSWSWETWCLTHTETSVSNTHLTHSVNAVCVGCFYYYYEVERQSLNPGPSATGTPSSSPLLCLSLSSLWVQLPGVNVRPPWCCFSTRTCHLRYQHLHHQTTFTILTGSRRHGWSLLSRTLSQASPSWRTEFHPPGSQQYKGHTHTHTHTQIQVSVSKVTASDKRTTWQQWVRFQYRQIQFQRIVKTRWDQTSLYVYSHQSWIIFFEERFPNINTHRITVEGVVILNAQSLDFSPRDSDSLSIEWTQESVLLKQSKGCWCSWNDPAQGASKPCLDYVSVRASQAA